MLNELIRPPNPDHRRVDHLRIEMLHDRAAEAVVQDVILDRANNTDAARKELERAGVERLDPARIDKRDR